MSRTTTLSVLVILTLLVALAACGPTASPTATQVSVAPTTAPAATTAMTATTAPSATTAASATVAASATIAASATVAASPTAPQVTQAKYTFGMAVHADPSVDPFWAVVLKGAQDAADTYGITLKAGGSSDPAAQATLVTNYVAAKVDGIFVSLANPDAMKDAVTSAVNAGIPVITINSGLTVWKSFGALTHVGQDESIAGQGAGEKWNQLGAKYVLCVIHEEANVGLQQRCDGLKQTFSGTVENFSVASTGVANPAATATAIQNKLIATPQIDAIMTLNPLIAVTALDAIQANGSNQMLGTFDLSPDVLNDITAGTMSFAIDQQQYLQGYLPVVLLYLYDYNLNVVGGGQPVLTGPGFVTKDNAAQVLSYSQRGTR
jgi:simple sugar transport system substrate-binding protein